jgi:hypothetical protein
MNHVDLVEFLQLGTTCKNVVATSTRTSKVVVAFAPGANLVRAGGKDEWLGARGSFRLIDLFLPKSVYASP